MNLARTALLVCTAAALVLGGAPAALAAEPPPPAAPGPAPGVAAAAAPAAVLSGGTTLGGGPVELPPQRSGEVPADPRPAAPGVPGAAAATSLPTTAEQITEVFDIVNDHRRQARRAPLAYSTELSRNAQQWARTMAGAGAPLHNPGPYAGAPAGAVRMDQYYGKGEFTGTFAGVDAVEAITHYLLDFFPRNGTDQFARDLTHLGIGVAHVPTTGAAGPGWQTYVTIYFYAYPPGTPVPGSFAAPPAGAVTEAAAFTVQGGIGAKYRALGGAAVVGVPITDERGGLAGGGWYQHFARNGRTSAIYWAPAHGAHWVKTFGAIGQRWLRAGAERGWGYPTAEEKQIPGGWYQAFRSGGRSTTVVWSPGSGAHPVAEGGAIAARWRAAGAERGYGFPTGAERLVGTEWTQAFSKGVTVHYSTATKRTWVTR